MRKCFICTNDSVLLLKWDWGPVEDVTIPLCLEHHTIIQYEDGSKEAPTINIVRRKLGAEE